MHFSWQLATFDELSNAQLYAILMARQEVFVVEQYCPYLDADGMDEVAYHLMGWEGDTLLAYLRILPPGITGEAVVIGRVLTVKKARKSGLGKMAMTKGMAHANALFPNKSICISAQTYLQAFYEELGFKFTGKAYLEDGIPHIEMITP